MSNLSDEQLSSLLDGELDESRRRHALEALSHDAEARERWERFNLARDALHGNLPDGIDLQFSSRVRAAIDDEPAILAPPPRNPAASTDAPAGEIHAPSRFSRRFAGLAVAASVAAMAVMGVETLYRDDPAAPGGAQLAQGTDAQPDFVRLAKRPVPPAPAMAPVNTPQASTMTNPSLAAARVEVLRAHPEIVRRIDPRLHKYLINHSQQAARSNIQGVMPFARIVTYPGAQHQSVQR